MAPSSTTAHRFGWPWKTGLIDPTKMIQIGIRGGQNTLEGLEFSRNSGMRVVMMDEFSKIGVEKVIEEARPGRR